MGRSLTVSFSSPLSFSTTLRRISRQAFKGRSLPSQNRIAAGQDGRCEDGGLRLVSGSHLSAGGVTSTAAWLETEGESKSTFSPSSTTNPRYRAWAFSVAGVCLVLCPRRVASAQATFDASAQVVPVPCASASKLSRNAARVCSELYLAVLGSGGAEISDLDSARNW